MSSIDSFVPCYGHLVTEKTDSGVRVNTWLHEMNTFDNEGTDEQQDSSVLSIRDKSAHFVSASFCKILSDDLPPNLLLLSGSPSVLALLHLQAVMKGMCVAVFVSPIHEPGCS